MYVHFVHFEKAFDYIDRRGLWVIMKKNGIPSKLIAIVKALYKDFQCAVIDEGEKTEWFPVVTRVKQGCCMSGFLFIMKTDWVMRQTVENKKTGIRWNFTVLEDLDFADDIALLSSTFDQLQTKATRLEENAGRVGLKLNAKKCKVMKLNSKEEDALRVGQNGVEEVEHFTYLGADVTHDGGGTVDIQRRIDLASAVFHKLAKVFYARHRQEDQGDIVQDFGAIYTTIWV